MTYKRPNEQDAGTPFQESHGVNVDQSFKDLLEASSLGTQAARRIRSSTSTEVVDDVRLRMERKLSLRDVIARDRQRDFGSALRGRPHRRFPAALRWVPLLVFGIDALLLLNFFSGVTNVNWAKPLSAALISAGLAAVMVTGISFAFFRFTSGRLEQYKDGTGVISLCGLDEATTVSVSLALGGIITLAAPMVIRMHAEVLHALGPDADGSAIIISLALALAIILANTLVIAVRALDGSAEAGRLSTLGPVIYGHHLRAAAADRLIDATVTVHQGVGPPSEPAVNPNGEKSVIGSNRASGTREDKRRPRRSYYRLTKAVALAAAAVIAIVVATAATVFGLRFSSSSSITSSPGARVVIAATATANEPAPTLPADILQTLRSAGLARTPATAYVVAPGASHPDTISLTPRSTDGQVDYGPTRSAVLDANISAVERALGNQANTGQLDVLSALAEAVSTTSSPGTLIVVSSGLSTAGAFDLRQIGWDAVPSSLAAQLRAQKGLPDLAGWRVIFSGLGDVAGRQRALPLPQQVTLESYWIAICRASGAAACSVDNTPRPHLASHVTGAVPVVSVPGVATAAGPAYAATITLPDRLLFQFNSTTLFPSAETILQPIMQKARSHHLLVSITGNASPDGDSDAYNLALSAKRADAVKDKLIALGLAARQIVRVAGAGTAGRDMTACLVYGQMDEAICTQLRRVVIALSPAKPTP
jgi:outer membrane protein OmpA-like peptidoglycan-associated protein